MSSFPLFSVMGIEIEYMLVDSETLDVRPESDTLLQALAGKLCNEVELGEIAVSNELVMHVLELKNNGPKPPDAPIAQHFQQALDSLQPLLVKHHLQLLPTGAHPWMNPAQETRRWPHGNRDIYHQFDKIFNCQGHGWSNLQSMHINLPFANDDEFNQLHNAIRLILPLLPAISASTPFLDGQFTGMLDSRLDFYEKNQQNIPSICAGVIPEFVSSEGEYRDRILAPMYRDISAFDPEGILQHEWLNSRGVIPKFEYNALEIRIMDTQECVDADIALAKAVFAILQYWQQRSPYYLDKPCDRLRLKALYDQTRIKGLDVAVADSELLRQWQINKPMSTCRQVWSHLIEQVSPSLDANSQRTLEYILSQGNLAERMLRACGNDHSKTNLTRIYRQLGHCLMSNQVFNPS